MPPETYVSGGLWKKRSLWRSADRATEQTELLRTANRRDEEVYRRAKDAAITVGRPYASQNTATRNTVLYCKAWDTRLSLFEKPNPGEPSQKSQC